MSFNLHVLSSITRDGQKVQANQVSIDGQMDKVNVVRTHSGILYSLKKEGHSERCCHMDKP